MSKKMKPGKMSSSSDNLVSSPDQYGSAGPWVGVSDQSRPHVRSSEREAILQGLQDMFAGSLERDVVHMVLSECDWKAEAALEKLLEMGPGEEPGKRPQVGGLPPAAQFPALHMPPPPLPAMNQQQANPFSMPPPPSGRPLMGQGAHAGSMPSYLHQPPPTSSMYNQISPPLAINSPSSQQQQSASLNIMRQNSNSGNSATNLRSRLPSVHKQDNMVPELTTLSPRTPHVAGMDYPVFKTSSAAEESMQSAMEALDSYAKNAQAQTYENNFQMQTAGSMFDWNMQSRENRSPYSVDPPHLQTPSPGAPLPYCPMQGLGPFDTPGGNFLSPNFNQNSETKTVSPSSYMAQYGGSDNNMFNVPPPTTSIAKTSAGISSLYNTPPPKATSPATSATAPYVSWSTDTNAMSAAIDEHEGITSLAAVKARRPRRVPRKAAISLNPEERESLEQLIEEVIIGGVGEDIIDDSTSSEEEMSDGSKTDDKSTKKDEQGKTHPSHLKVAAKHMKNLPPRFLRRLQAAQKQGEIRVEGGLENLDLDYELPEEMGLEIQAELDNAEKDRRTDHKRIRKKKGLLESLDPYFDDLVLSDSENNESKENDRGKDSSQLGQLNVSTAPSHVPPKEPMLSPQNKADHTSLMDPGRVSGPPSRSSPRLIRAAVSSSHAPPAPGMGMNSLAINARELEEQLRQVTTQGRPSVPPAAMPKTSSDPLRGHIASQRNWEHRVNELPVTDHRMKFSVNAPEFVPKTFIPVSVPPGGPVLLEQARERTRPTHYAVKTGSPYHSPVGRLSPANLALGPRIAQVRHTPSPTFLVPKASSSVVSPQAALQAQALLQSQAALQTQAALHSQAAMQSQAAAAASLMYSPYTLPPGYAYAPGLPAQFAYRPTYIPPGAAAVPPPNWSPEKLMDPRLTHRGSPYGVDKAAWIQALSPRHSPIPHLHPQARLPHTGHTPKARHDKPSKQPSAAQWADKMQDSHMTKGMDPKSSDSAGTNLVDVRARLSTLLKDGKKVMVIIRGPSGCGKSQLAKELKGDGVVLTTDDFFMNGEKYDFDFAKLSDAHDWNRKRAKTAMMEGTSPVIIDNTNSQSWEMKPYVALAVQHKYLVEFALPNTPWLFKPKELVKRSSHGVTLDTIERMIERFEHRVTVESILGLQEIRSEEGDAQSMEDPSTPLQDGSAQKKPHRRRKRRRRKAKGKDASASETGDEKLDEDKDSSDEEGTPDRDKEGGANEAGDGATLAASKPDLRSESSVDSTQGQKPMPLVTDVSQKVEEEEEEEAEQVVQDDGSSVAQMADEVSMAQMADEVSVAQMADEVSVADSAVTVEESALVASAAADHSLQEVILKEAGASTESAEEVTEDVDKQLKSGNVNCALEVGEDALLNSDLPSPAAAAEVRTEAGADAADGETPAVLSDPSSQDLSKKRKQTQSVSSEELEVEETQPVRLEPELKEGIQRALKQILGSCHNDSNQDIIQMVLREHLQPYKLPVEIQSEIEDIIKEKMLDGLMNKEVAELTEAGGYKMSQPYQVHYHHRRGEGEGDPGIDLYARHYPHLHQGGAHSLPNDSELHYWQQLQQPHDPYAVRVTAPPQVATTQEAGLTSMAWSDPKPERETKPSKKTIMTDESSGVVRSAFRSRRLHSAPVPTLDSQVKSQLLRQDWVLTRMQADPSALPQEQEELALSANDATTYTHPKDFSRTQRMAETGLHEYGFVGVRPCQARDIQVPGYVEAPQSPCKKLKVSRGCSTDDLEHSVQSYGVEFLRTCFSTVSESDLEEIMQRCEGDIEWAVNLLLDAGYEYNDPQNEMKMSSSYVERQSPDGSDSESDSAIVNSPLPLIVLGQVALQSSELTSPEVQEDLVAGSMKRLKFVEEFHHQHYAPVPSAPPPPMDEDTQEQPLRRLVTYDDDDEEDDGDEDEQDSVIAGGLKLQLPRSLAAQLMEMFGPVGFLDTPGNLSQDEMQVNLDYAAAEALHRCWAATLMGQLEPGAAAATYTIKEDEALARQLQAEEDEAASPARSPLKVHYHPAPVTESRESSQSPQPSLREIMDEEQAMELSKKQYGLDFLEREQRKEQRATLLATKMKWQKLQEMFPDLDPVILEAIFKQTNYSLGESVGEIRASLGSEEVPRTVMSPEALAAYEASLLQQAKEASLKDQAVEVCDAPEVSYQNIARPEYHDFRGEAHMHFQLRHDCFQKAQDAYRKGMKGVASFYSQQGHLHTEKLKEANMRAAQQIVDHRGSTAEQSNQIDLHFLHVDEALQVLESIIADREQDLREKPDKRKQNLFVVTGRGKHSHGGVAKIRPAIIEFLKRKKYNETQPGLLKVSLKYRSH